MRNDPGRMGSRPGKPEQAVPRGPERQAVEESGPREWLVQGSCLWREGLCRVCSNSTRDAGLKLDSRKTMGSTAGGEAGEQWFLGPHQSGEGFGFY